jgi:UDP-3-O-[3-hydroxymyristoyl] glucosamine N-acyltransferase
MKLSHLDPQLHHGLRQDGEFNLLGKATTAFQAHHRVLTYLTDVRYLDGLRDNPAIAGVIVTAELLDTVNLPDSLGILLDPNPKKAFVRIHNALAETDFYWTRFPSVIDPTAIISPHAVIADVGVKIGARVVIEPHVTVHSGTFVGDDCVIRSGTRLGSSGFEFLKDGDGMLSVTCAGRLILEDHVEVQHNCAIDRGMYGGDTRLGAHVKVDNLVYIAHDVRIGPRTTVAGSAVILGRCVVGSDVWVGPNATISNGLTLGDHAKVSLGSVVTRDVVAHQTVTGNFAIDHAKYLAFLKSVR